MGEAEETASLSFRAGVLFGRESAMAVFDLAQNEDNLLAGRGGLFRTRFDVWNIYLLK